MSERGRHYLRCQTCNAPVYEIDAKRCVVSTLGGPRCGNCEGGEPLIDYSENTCATYATERER